MRTIFAAYRYFKYVFLQDALPMTVTTDDLITRGDCAFTATVITEMIIVVDDIYIFI